MKEEFKNSKIKFLKISHFCPNQKMTLKLLNKLQNNNLKE